jgi:hypothetical protein
MDDISIQIPFDSTIERIAAATKELVAEIYRGYLGRHPTKDEASRFQQRSNADNKSINDQYFDGRKIGSLMTTYTLDIPRCISIRFNQKQ